MDQVDSHVEVGFVVGDETLGYGEFEGALGVLLVLMERYPLAQKFVVLGGLGVFGPCLVALYGLIVICRYEVSIAQVRVQVFF